MSWDAVSVTGKYDFRFREVGSSSWNTITNFLGTSYTLNGLSDGTDYEFEVRSMCGGGFTLLGCLLLSLLYWLVLHLRI